jgi:hypothetical protein
MKLSDSGKSLTTMEIRTFKNVGANSPQNLVVLDE